MTSDPPMLLQLFARGKGFCILNQPEIHNLPPNLDSPSIMSSAKEHLPSDDAVFQDFMGYLKSTTIGVEIHGVLIDKAFVNSLYNTLITKLVPGVPLLAQFLKDANAVDKTE